MPRMPLERGGASNVSAAERLRSAHSLVEGHSPTAALQEARTTRYHGPHRPAVRGAQALPWGTRWTSDVTGVDHHLTVREHVEVGEWSSAPLHGPRPPPCSCVMGVPFAPGVRVWREGEGPMPGATPPVKVTAWPPLCEDCHGERHPPRSRGGLGKPLDPRWYQRAARCAKATVPMQRHAAAAGWDTEPGRGRCDSPYCESCGTRGIGRGLRKARAAFAGIYDDLGGRVDLQFLTITRARATTAEDVARFRQAVRVFDSLVRFAGVLGVVWVFEVKVHAEEEDTWELCHHGEADGPCPLCGQRAGGCVPPGHLHAHGIAVIPRGKFIPWEWLHGLKAVREIDPAVGRIDVGDESRKRKHGSRMAGSVDALFGYVGAYVQRIKEPLGRAWLRRMGGQGARFAERTGALRGAAAQVTDVHNTVEATHEAHDVSRYFRVRDKQTAERARGREHVAASCRDAHRVLRAKGIVTSAIAGERNETGGWAADVAWLEDWRRGDRKRRSRYAKDPSRLLARERAGSSPRPQSGPEPTRRTTTRPRPPPAGTSPPPPGG